MAEVTDEGVIFIGDSEGFRSKAYRDQGGVITIGYGFTMGSRIFADWWRYHHNGALAMGDVISRNDANLIFKAMLDDEYGAAVNRRFDGIALEAHEHDGTTSVTYNAGPGTLNRNGTGDRWIVALADGAVSKAARLLRSTRVTARGVGHIRRYRPA